MHKASGVQFTHTCINNGIACFTLTPYGELLLIIAPFNMVVFFFERCTFTYVVKLREYHLVKLTPYQLFKIYFAMFICFGGELAYAYRAKTQVNTDMTGAVNTGKIAGVSVMLYKLCRYSIGGKWFARCFKTHACK